MPDLTPQDSSSPLLNEALAWLVHFHSGHASETDRRACCAWRTRSTAHDLAYHEAEALWRNLGELRSNRRPLDLPAVPTIRRSKQAGIGKVP